MPWTLPCFWGCGPWNLPCFRVSEAVGLGIYYVSGAAGLGIYHVSGPVGLGIYYVSVPENCGNFAVLRNDGSQYCNLYENRQDMLEYIIEPEVGRLYILPGHLWHYVESSQSTKDRISISFNIYT